MQPVEPSLDSSRMWLENVRFSTLLSLQVGSLKLPMLWWICLMVGHGCFGQKAVISCHFDQLNLHCNLRDCVLVIYLVSIAFEWQVRHPKTWHLFAEGGLILRIRHLGISIDGSAHDSYMLISRDGWRPIFAVLLTFCERCVRDLICISPLNRRIH